MIEKALIIAIIALALTVALDGLVPIKDLMSCADWSTTNPCPVSAD